MPRVPQLLPSINSYNKVATNQDGSIDLYFAPEKPDNVAEPNWLPTARGRGFFAILRLYGPEQAGIDFSWKPGDFES